MPIRRPTGGERPGNILPGQSAQDMIVAIHVWPIIEIHKIESRRARVERQRAAEESRRDQKVTMNSIRHSLSFSSKYGLILSRPIRSCCIESRWRTVTV